MPDEKIDRRMLGVEVPLKLWPAGATLIVGEVLKQYSRPKG